MNNFDPFFRRIIFTKFFTKGWGHPDDLRRILAFRKVAANRETCQILVSKDHEVKIEKETVKNGIRTIDASFVSPFAQLLPGVMPKESEVSRFQMVVPATKTWKSRWGKELKPVCIHMAGTGDHGYGLRTRQMAKPLLEEAGIASIMVMNPFYGPRKPSAQLRSGLLHVSDLFAMGGALMLESLALYHWCKRQGYGPVALTGISKGGFMASLGASAWPEPVSLIPCLSWSTASNVYTRGALSGSVFWHVLQEQFIRDQVYSQEISRYIYSPEDNQGRINEDFLSMGKEFVANYPHNTSYVDILKGICRGEMNVPSLVSYHDKLKPALQNSSSIEVNFDYLSANAQIQNKQNPPASNPITNNSQAAAVAASISNNLTSMRTSMDAIYNMLSFHSGTSGNRGDLTDISDPVLQFMRVLMDECTHLGNYSAPVDPDLIDIVAARHDMYVLRDDVMDLTHLWPGAHVRYIDTGHVAGCSMYHKVFREAIIDSLDRQVKKYH